LTVTGANDKLLHTFSWTIDSDIDVVSSDVPNKLAGTEIVVKFKKTGIFPMSVTEYGEDGAILQTIQVTAISKYVKREIRTLTYADREAFLDAAATIWKYPTAEGQAIYGRQFTGIDTFTALHIMQSNDIMCDSYHEGSGFLSHHLALTNSFDAALRSIDPSVTLPYWDFTIEGQAIADAKKTPSYMLEVSPIFSDTWFGEVDENNHIINSRWAHTKIPLADASTPRNWKNSFGHWRSFWNNNPDPQVTRHMFEMCGLEASHKKVPTCLSHYNVLNSSSLAEFQMLSPSDGHGPVHIQTGGMYGGCAKAYNEFNEKWSTLLDEDFTAEQIALIGAPYGFDSSNWGYSLTASRRSMLEKTVMGEYFHIYRAFWRSHMCAIDAKPGYLECPDECDAASLYTGTAPIDADTDFTPEMAQEIIDKCGCSVNKLLTGATTWQNLYPCVVTDLKRDMFNAMFPQEMLKDMVTFIATNNILHGDMIESSSPADIIFWLIHPGIDRMLTAKRLPTESVMGDVQYMKWNVVDGSKEEWLDYSPYTLEAGDNLYFTEAYKCVGHAATDEVLSVKLPLTDAVLAAALEVDKGEHGNNDGEISNWEYFIAVDPNNVDGNDYVFDHFQWDHCKGNIL
jgi:Common central domain of tyrosinase